MEKTGWTKLKPREAHVTKIYCQCCPLPATKKVIYADQYGKVVLCLCDDCFNKDYFDITLQGRFL